MSNIEIYPLDEPLQKVIVYDYVSFIINEVLITPFKCANIFICLNTDTFQDINNVVSLLMEGEDYQLWNNNDEYLISWIKQQLKILYGK